MATGHDPGDVLVKKVNNIDDWIEDLLTASDVPVTLTGGDYTAAGISGSESQELFDSIADRLAPITISGSQTIVLIDNVRSISGVAGGILGNLEVIEFPQSGDGIVAFSFPVDTQPKRDLELKVLYGPLTTASGNFKFDLDYNIINLAGDLTPASFTASGTNTDNLVSGDNEELQSMTFTVSSSVFSGSAPMIFSGRLTRDTSVGSNYTGDIALVHLYSLIYAEI